MSLGYVRGFTHEQLREQFKAFEAESVRYPNPNDPENYTTLVVRWPNGVPLWQEICNRCSAIVEDRAGHNKFHDELLQLIKGS
jgi:hypothetical protein